MVDIVIPIYKPIPDNDEICALRQGFKLLAHYGITFVCPESLDITAYQCFGEAQFKRFDDKYFKGIYGYNQLMLSVDFYKAFSQKYILIYQTDAYVFADTLREWCDKDYDYIGAPWLRSSESIPLLKKIWDNTLCFVKQCTNYRGNHNTQKNKILLYNEVGNGGFSLRKREKFIEVLQSLHTEVGIYLKPINQSNFYAEDVFFSIEPQRKGLSFAKPSYKEACAFAIENKPAKALAYNNGKLPMGCHRWNKENRGFWKLYIDYEV